ncbi:MAG: metallophosphoesterase [Planctomycetes bacterium]|nr:metallophosphoesterase [Planctomycetota bacterium]
MSLVVLACVLLLAILGHGYFWIDGVNRLHAWSGPRVLIDIPTYAAVLAFLMLPMGVAWDWWHLGVGWTGYVWSQPGFLPRYLQFCVVWGVAKLVLNQIHQHKVDPPQTLLSSRQEKSSLVPDENPLPVSGPMTQVLARLPGNQCLQLTVSFKQLAIPSLHPKHEGLKIAHLSDLHMTGRIEQRWYEAVVEQTNQLEPDVIAITGDILEKEACWHWLPETLGRLRAKQGVYFILGNHDFFIDANRTRKILCDAGLIYVGGSRIETQWNGAAVLITGNERPWGVDELEDAKPGDCNPPALQGVSQKHDISHIPLKLALAHSPDQFAWTCRQDADLMLAGHTHGGQIRFPLLGAVACPSVHGTRYACGTFRSGKTVMHVSRGISGERPVRWNCPPEIALLELTAVR